MYKIKLNITLFLKDIRSSGTLFADNHPKPSEVKSNSESLHTVVQKNMLREAFGVISNVSKNCEYYLWVENWLLNHGTCI